MFNRVKVFALLALATCKANAETAFRARLSELGAELLEPYKSALKPHRVRCAAGHISNSTPNNIQRGRGICLSCAYQWDCFYIVRSDTGSIKFGITTGNAKSRLSDHARNGYADVIKLWTNLPGGYAHSTEQFCILMLRDAGIKPIRGQSCKTSNMSNTQTNQLSPRNPGRSSRPGLRTL
jgi:hypothetical protein